MTVETRMSFAVASYLLLVQAREGSPIGSSLISTYT